MKTCSKKTGCDFFVTSTGGVSAMGKAESGVLAVGKSDTASLSTEELNFIEI